MSPACGIFLKIISLGQIWTFRDKLLTLKASFTSEARVMLTLVCVIFFVKSHHPKEETTFDSTHFFLEAATWKVKTVLKHTKGVI